MPGCSTWTGRWPRTCPSSLPGETPTGAGSCPGSCSPTLPAVRRLWRTPGSRAEHARRVLSAPLPAPPGERHEYSCVGYLVLGLLLERLTGRPLPALVQASVTGPLRMTDTGYHPRWRPV